MWAYAQTSSQAAAIPWAAASVREIRTIGDPVLRERARELTTGEVALARGPGVDRRHGRDEARRSLSQTRGALAQLLEYRVMHGTDQDGLCIALDHSLPSERSDGGGIRTRDLRVMSPTNPAEALTADSRGWALMGALAGKSGAARLRRAA
jgi:hypothetical protein